MHRNLPRRKVTATLFLILLVTTLTASLLPETTATPSSVEINSINPTSGPVGTTVRVVGGINTVNGSYRILFDGKAVKNGTVAGTAVNDTFRVPPSVGGNHDVALFDVTNSSQSLPATFNVMTSYSVEVEPARIQEGLNTTITVGVNGAEANTTITLTIDVTDPTLAQYSTTLFLSTNASGSGFNSALYHGDFSVGANTNYVGMYTVAVNGTLATGNFTVGLTDAIEYRRFKVVGIRAAGYQADELVWVNITRAEEDVIAFENNASLLGVVEANWEIPWDAQTGLYTVTITNASSLPTKSVPDTQNFAVVQIIPISIGPTSGSWETTVRVVGEIVKPGGSYEFRWDGTLVKLGNCSPGSIVVNDTFTVPISFRGYHNITLLDVNQTTESVPVTFQVTTSVYVSPEPARILEGLTTTITVGLREAKINASYIFVVNVTDPLNGIQTADTRVVTNAEGFGENSTFLYPNNFAGANTNYLGSYSVTVNATLANSSFAVGLTDELEYRVTNDVLIRGSGYEPGKFITANITLTETGKTVFSQSSNATDGTVSYKWIIPENATLGIYSVALTDANATSIVKQIPDVQNFTVIRIIVYVQTRNKYDNMSLVGVTIWAYIGTTLIASGRTNDTGWVDFTINRANYTFIATWENAIVGVLSQDLPGNTTEYVLQKVFYVDCELANVKIEVIDEAGQPLPFISVTFSSNRTGTLEFITNDTGTIALNTFTYLSYTIEARRYGNLFNTTLIENLTTTRLITIACPTYTLFVNTLDSKGLPLRNVQVSVYEWTSERVTGQETTDDFGSVSLDLTFGRYKIRVYNYSAELHRTVVLNETVIDLTENQFFVVIQSKIYNLDLSVSVVDYFGQPLPNAAARLEREFEHGYESISNLTTRSDGTASLPKIGGNYRISVYVAGNLLATRTLSLEGSRVIVFRIDSLVVVAGYPVETTQFVTGIALAILLVLLVLALIYRKLRVKKVQEKK